ncbi:MAG: MmgE/PrpD family protein [Advenella sp.]
MLLNFFHFFHYTYFFVTMQTTDLIDQPATMALAAFASSLTFDQIPAELVDDVKLHLLDGIGVALYGSQLPWTQHVAQIAMAEGCTPVATLLGDGRRTSALNAVLVNATAGHAFEMDDIHKNSVLHPNSLGVPVVLALAEGHPGIGGADVITALTAGTEIGVRVGNAATTALFLNGFHPQGTTGAFVSAAAAGRLLRLTPGQMQHTLGIAGSMGAGLMAAQEGAMVKRLHAGRAAQAGLQAALLAQQGFTGIENILEAGYGGFLSAFARTCKPERLLDGLGTDWEAGKVGYKMYPNVTSIHAALDAMKALMREHGVHASDIDRIEVGCGHMTYVHTAWRYEPKGVTAAQMNLFYGLAVMALRGSVSARDYAQARIADPEVMDFISRIHPFEDEIIESRGAEARHAARLQVKTKSGQLLSHDVWARRGSPENPVIPAEITEKFFANSSHLLNKTTAEELVRQVLMLESLDSLEGIISLLKEERT